MDRAAPAVPGPVHVRLPRRDFLSHAAARVLGANGTRALRDAVLVVPDLHATADVALALQRASGSSVLLLPKIATLRTWAEDLPLGSPVLGDAARVAMLYGALSGRGWFPEADLWAVCSELARLFDELTRERVRLAATPAEFAAWLRSAYRAKAGAPLEFEARVVHDLWAACASGDGPLDRERAYVARLARRCTTPSGPLHIIAPRRHSRAETEFLAAYAQRAPVTIYEPHDDVMPGSRTRTLAAAWPAAAAQGLKSRAEALRELEPVSALAGRIRIAAALTAEHEAQIVDLAVRELLIGGASRVAVVVQDRITARRARALLERAGVLVSDEAGWALSTTSAATAVARWLDAARGNFYHRDLLDLLKSPFVFGDWPREQRQQAVWRLEMLIRKANAMAGIDRYMALAESSRDGEVRKILAALRTAAAPLQRRKATLAQWLNLLLESLDAIGVMAAWSMDAAGLQVIELLQDLASQLRGDALVVDHGVWRSWLAAQLDNAAFRDRSVESPVIFTYLGALALRRFDGLIIAGADASHLPGPDTDSRLFNQAVRAQLGLRTRADASAELDAVLRDVVTGCDHVVVTWQRLREGEPNLLAPAFERLDALHRLAYGEGLHDEALPARAAAACIRAADETAPPSASARPAPRVPPDLVPAVVSASGHNTLMSCPYQFYARYVLRLAELDDVQELMEKGDYGQCVHAALAAFHRRHPRVRELDAEEAVHELERCSEDAFAASLGANYLARAWLERWRALIPQYVAWQREYEARGWQVAQTEVERRAELVTPAGHKVELRGRIDRVDRNADGSTALVDYKTQRRDRLRTRAEADGEDVQLPFYVLLWQDPVAAAMFLGMERDGVAGHAIAADVDRLAEAVRARLAALYDSMRAGAPLPAHGAEEVCAYCEVSGLCRRSHWP